MDKRDKWWYIQEISNMPDVYGNLLVYMLKKYNKSMQEITDGEAKEYYEYIIESRK